MKSIIFLLLLFPIAVFSQKNLEGRVIDNNNSGISNATIFINGTTIGTISDSNGYFILENVTAPCHIGVSHIKYEPNMINFKDTTYSNITIFLKARNIQLKQVKVSNRNKRANNVNSFKNNFLGYDYFGKMAILLNDNDLFFTNKYVYKETKMPKNLTLYGDIKKEIIHKNDGDYIIHKEITNKSVSAKAPLKIDLPYLGYRIHTELIDYQVNWNNNHNQMCTFLGYYFFTPYKPERRKYIIRRKKAYYNSSLHFCRSIYKNQLKNNGFQLLEVTENSRLKTRETKLINRDSLNIVFQNNVLQIIGLKGKHFTIIYNCRSNGSPKDLNTHKLNSGPQSLIYFNSDTCKINSNGIISDNSIIFGGSISEKKVGALLPENYSPNE